MLKFAAYFQEYENKRNVFIGIVVNKNKWHTNVTSQMLKIKERNNNGENDLKINAIERTKETSISFMYKATQIIKVFISI